MPPSPWTPSRLQRPSLTNLTRTTAAQATAAVLKGQRRLHVSGGDDDDVGARRAQGVFGWAAGHSVRLAKGSRKRLFLMIYSVGVVVTIFLSNDATAVVLTPAVLAAVEAAEAESLPYLFACAFIANAASFVLPISHPANLVVYRQGMPLLGRWLLTFGLPSIVSILVTFLALRLLSRKLLSGTIKTEVERSPLSPQGKTTLLGIALLAAALMTASAFSADLGAPTLAVGIAVSVGISFQNHGMPGKILKEVS